MKLSEVKGEKSVELLADIIPHITNIALDEEASAFFKRKAVPKGKTPREAFLERYRDALPTLLKNHSDDLISIVSAVEGRDKSEYLADLDMGKIMKVLLELITDDAFMTLF